MDSDSESDNDRRMYKQKQLKPINDCLVNEIQKVLTHSPDHHLLKNQKHYHKLTLKIIQKKPLFLSDDRTCIQSMFKQPTNDIFTKEPNPFNHYSTPYYKPHPKPHIVYNCHDQAIEGETPIYPSAYHPAYFFKNYEQYKEKKDKVQILESCERIEVLCWSLIVVNINEKGYYGIILYIHEYKKLYGQQLLQKYVGNILFERRISEYLDDYRVLDMKQSLRDHSRSLKDHSFTYYMKNYSLNQNQRGSSFVSIDIKNNYISCNQSLPIKMIPLGNLSQFQIFKRPVHHKYLTTKCSFHFDRFVQPNHQQGQNEESSSYSDSSEKDQDFYRPQQAMQIENEGEDMHRAYQYQAQMQSEDDQSSGQDYLRKLYKEKLDEMIKGNRII